MIICEGIFLLKEIFIRSKHRISHHKNRIVIFLGSLRNDNTFAFLRSRIEGNRLFGFEVINHFAIFKLFATLRCYCGRCDFSFFVLLSSCVDLSCLPIDTDVICIYLHILIDDLRFFVEESLLVGDGRTAFVFRFGLYDIIQLFLWDDGVFFNSYGISGYT